MSLGARKLRPQQFITNTILLVLVLRLIAGEEGSKNAFTNKDGNTLLIAREEATSPILTSDDLAHFLSTVENGWERQQGREVREVRGTDTIFKQSNVDFKSSHPLATEKWAPSALIRSIYLASIAKRFTNDLIGSGVIPNHVGEDGMLSATIENGSHVAPGFILALDSAGGGSGRNLQQTGKQCDTTTAGIDFCIDVNCPLSDNGVECSCSFSIEDDVCESCIVCEQENAREIAYDCRKATSNSDACLTCSDEPCADEMVLDLATTTEEYKTTRRCETLIDGSEGCVELSCITAGSLSVNDCTCEFSLNDEYCTSCTYSDGSFGFDCTNFDHDSCIASSGDPCHSPAEMSRECETVGNGVKVCIEMSCPDGSDECACSYSVGDVDCSSCTVCGPDKGFAADCRNIGDSNDCVTCEGKTCEDGSSIPDFPTDVENNESTRQCHLQNGLELCMELGCPSDAKRITDCSCWLSVEEDLCGSCTVCGGNRDFAADCRNLEGVDACFSCLGEECEDVRSVSNGTSSSNAWRPMLSSLMIVPVFFGLTFTYYFL